jgi:hypothetical protein
VTEQERTTAKFLRGLTIGALIGAVIAGSRFWRWFERRAPKTKR